MATERGRDASLRRFDMTFDQGEIFLEHGTRLKLCLQRPVRSVIFGNDNQPGGLFVQPVNDTGPPFAAYPFDLRTMVQHSVDQCHRRDPGQDAQLGQLACRSPINRHLHTQ